MENSPVSSEQNEKLNLLAQEYPEKLERSTDKDSEKECMWDFNCYYCRRVGTVLWMLQYCR